MPGGRRGNPQAAEEVERSLIRDGAMNDPRTFSLYLATRGQQVQKALHLAQDELNTRADVFTIDALAWALNANGRVPEALEYSKKALSEGTQDARLFYHAGSHRPRCGRLRRRRKVIRALRSDQTNAHAFGKR